MANDHRTWWEVEHLLGEAALTRTDFLCRRVNLGGRKFDLSADIDGPRSCKNFNIGRHCSGSAYAKTTPWPIGRTQWQGFEAVTQTFMCYRSTSFRY
ncbi:hypothetical protein GWI33_021316 [Rhynchophorus ferrugineus]|uniref:Uncharacterized protein n=1 Tax=Rhynchophorus ferrugineus TaxID=354439 RepID=A0A834LZS8_RHYFE|nr:hypothetical protein GWI33_021316 [Rhynchophorus ferrugineus]